MALVKCPTCRRMFESEADCRPEQSSAMPFCSERCRQIDLGRWLGEKYAVPVPPSQEDASEDLPENGRESPD